MLDRVHFKFSRIGATVFCARIIGTLFFFLLIFEAIRVAFLIETAAIEVPWALGLVCLGYGVSGTRSKR